MNLIEAQQNHIDRVLAMTPYRDSNNMGCGQTLLNRKVRSLRASRGKYRNDLHGMGYTDEVIIRITMQDAEDMAVLEYNSED